MNNASLTKPASNLKLIAILTAFFLIGTAMFGWSVVSAMDMLEEIYSHARYITLNKGVYYLFGGGLFFLVMVLGVPIGYIIGYFVDDRYAKTYGKIYAILMIVSVVIAFVLPQAVHYFTEKYVFDNGYVVCEEKSYQWLHARKIVYARTLPCDNN